MPFTWEVTPSTAFEALTDAYIESIRAGVRTLAHRYAAEIENYMKANAPWTDRTSNARQTLTATVEDISMDMVQITLAHGVEYGIYLELAHAGVWGIISPTIDVFGPRLWADVQRLLN